MMIMMLLMMMMMLLMMMMIFMMMMMVLMMMMMMMVFDLQQLARLPLSVHLGTQSFLGSGWSGGSEYIFKRYLSYM